MQQTVVESIRDAILNSELLKAAELMSSEAGGRPAFALEINSEKDADPSMVSWEMTSPAQCRLLVSARAVREQGYALRIPSVLPLLIAYHRWQAFRPGSVILSLGDVARGRVLGFCASDPAVVLIPDAPYIRSDGYMATRRFYRANDVPWNEREPIAFWRGSSTGRRQDDWRQLPRMQLCMKTSRSELFDVGISNVVQQGGDSAISAEIEAAGIVKGRVPWRNFIRYKYQIDIDGNSNSWPGLFMKLLTGSPVIKVESASGFRQWYYNKLDPWKNYVPVRSDMTDLIEKVEWLVAHDQEAEAIGRAGRELADSLDCSGELSRAAPVIAALVDEDKV